MTDPWADLHDAVDDYMLRGKIGDYMDDGTWVEADMSVDGVFDADSLVLGVQGLRDDLFYLRRHGDSYFPDDGRRLDDVYEDALGLARDVFVVLDRLAERRNQAEQVTA